MNFYNKNILLVLHTGCLGGAERQGLGISKILTRDYNCTVNVLLTFSEEISTEFENYAKECQVQNILHFASPYLICRREFSVMNLKRLVWSVKYLLKIKKGLLPYQPDIIIPFLNFPSKVSYYLYKLLPSAKFTFWHQLGMDTNSLDLFESIAVNNIPCAIGNASNCLDMFKTTYKIDPRKLHVLPQYISLEFKEGDKNKLRKQYEIPCDAIVIGMIAHFRPEKYHELLLDVFDNLNDKHNNIYLVFLGNKSSTTVTANKFNYLVEKVKEKNLERKISIFSEVKVEDILNVLDIGVLVSHIEGMPNAVMEYMLYNLPVVTTNHPGCIELLKDSPFLIENNKNQLFESLNRLILSESLRKSEGDSNAEKIKAYDMASYINKLEIIMNNSI